MDDHRTHQCSICCEKNSWTKDEMRRHVAVYHACGIYSTISCGVCKEKCFDMRHFQEHADYSQRCSEIPYKVTYEPLQEHVKSAFHSLVDQMMRPLCEHENQHHIGENENRDRAAAEGPPQSIPVAQSITISDDEGDDEEIAGITPKITAREGAPLIKDEPRDDLDVVSFTTRIEDIALVRDVRIVLTPLPVEPEATDDSDDDESNRSLELNVTTDGSTSIKRKTESSKSYGKKQTKRITEVSSQATSPAERNKTNDGDKEGSDMSKERRRRCHQLIGQFSDNLGRVHCKICRSSVSVLQQRTKTFIRISLALDHALMHLAKLTCRCLICDARDVNRDRLRRHIKKRHNASFKVGVTYDDFSDQYHQEILEMLDRCYVTTRTDDNLESDEKQVNSRQRSKYASQLVRKFMKGTHIKCKICSAPTRGTLTSKGHAYSRSLVHHATAHLKKPLYRCRMCNVIKATLTDFHSHTYWHHRGKRHSEICIDLTDQFHGDIIKQIADCFDYEDSTMRTRERADGEGSDQLAVAGGSTIGYRRSGCSDETSTTSLSRVGKPVGQFSCQQCGYRTKYGRLFRGHLKLMHE